MNAITIEKAFSAALNHAKSAYGKKFQARVCEISGAHPPNLSAILNRDGGCSEELRRKIIAAVAQLSPGFPAKTYEEFLSLGEWIIAGKNPEDWKPALKGSITPSIPWIQCQGLSRNISGQIQPAGEQPATHKVPLISWVKAGDWTEAVDLYCPGYAEHWVPVAKQYGPNAFALTVEGDSMEPEFREGDYIVVDPSLQWTSGSYVVAKNGESATFKQIIVDGSSVFLKPLNDRYPVKDMTGIEFKIVGVVVFKGKEY